MLKPSSLRPSLSWLLVFIPVSLLAGPLTHRPVVVFVTTCLAIVPLAGLIGQATDQLAIRAGPRVGGLLNATFGNVTELIIAVLLVRAGEFEVVKASLVGSILGNLVLVLGAAYLAGGLRFSEQRFSARMAAVHASSLLLAVTALMMPAVFVLSQPDTRAEREVISVTVAAVLIVLYGASLLFTLVTHSRRLRTFRSPAEEERPEWSLPRAVVVLLLAAVAVGVESELLVGSLEPTVLALGVSRLFVGLFVVAVVGNAAEHAAAVVFALRNRMDVSIEIAFGSSIQIALLVAPLLVFVSLALGRPMDFVFAVPEIAAVALATLVVSVISMDGRSTWLEGLQLLGVYIILGVSLFYIRA
ncbi:MAG TPA: calcium/proton exchanger [Candidatus Dormibacteraeota bacterium]|nr:calcium/proton exchanger [Candidatus Dormibacteraeota bacterium]